MSPILSSQGVVLATAMVVSSTVIFLVFSKQSAPSQLRSCLSSGKMKVKNRKKKRVRFAEGVKDTKGNGEEYRREKEIAFLAKEERERVNSLCRSEMGVSHRAHEMPANRTALYNGILRDRVHRVQCSY